MSEAAKLSTDSVVMRVEGTLEAEVDQEIVAVNLDNGACYELNDVGSSIWKIVARPSRVADLCASLVAEYEVDPKKCESEVLNLLEELRGEHLIEVVGATSAPEA